MKDKKELNDKENKDKLYKKILLIIIAIILVTVTVILFVNNSNNKENEIAYSELIKKVDAGEIQKIEMTVGGTTAKITLVGASEEDEGKYRTIIPSITAFTELMQEKVAEGKTFEFVPENVSPIVNISATMFAMLPTFVLIVLVIMIFKMQGLGDKGKIYGGESENDTNTKFEDVAGLDEEKEELYEIVDFLKKPERYKKMGAKIPRGVLLCGKPGTGKTLIARAIAGEANVPFISMSGSEFIEMFAGLGASRVRKLFERAKKIAPCIIFIDEIDAIGARRSGGGGGAETEQTLNQLLTEMDGFDTNETIIVLAATNRPEMLDKALLRPGRFDRQITVATPDIKGREEILKIHARDKELAPNVNLKDIAGDTAGFTGAELSNILNEAAILATRYGHAVIEHIDIENAVKKVTVGIEKTSRVISEKDKKLTAYHEAGHAIVSKFLHTSEDVKEVSIIPRGLAGGYTMYKTIEDKFYVSKREMEERLVTLLGGRAGEKVALDDISTGASNDIEVATRIARDMIVVYGMNEKVGPISLKRNDPYEDLMMGEDIENIIGEEVKKLVSAAYVSAQQILRDNMDILHAVAQTLIEKEKISGEEFEQFFK